MMTAYCSGRFHQIINALDKRGYETELHSALKSAHALVIKDLSTCIAMGGPDIILQSQNSRSVFTSFFMQGVT